MNGIGCWPVMSVCCPSAIIFIIAFFIYSFFFDRLEKKECEYVNFIPYFVVTQAAQGQSINFGQDLVPSCVYLFKFFTLCKFMTNTKQKLFKYLVSYNDSHSLNHKMYSF